MADKFRPVRVTGFRLRRNDEDMDGYVLLNRYPSLDWTGVFTRMLEESTLRKQVAFFWDNAAGNRVHGIHIRKDGGLFIERGAIRITELPRRQSQASKLVKYVASAIRAANNPSNWDAIDEPLDEKELKLVAVQPASQEIYPT